MLEAGAVGVKRFAAVTVIACDIKGEIGAGRVDGHFRWRGDVISQRQERLSPYPLMAKAAAAVAGDVDAVFGTAAAMEGR